MKLKPFRNYINSVIKGIIADDLWGIANALTYKLLLALFPFIIFLASLVGFLNPGGIAEGDMAFLAGALPPQVREVISAFEAEVLAGRRLGVLSASLLVTVFSASSGFRAVIRGVNISYNAEETRSPLRVGLIAVGLVFLFAASINICLVVLIFGNSIMAFAESYYSLPDFAYTVYAAARGFGAITALFLAVCAIYKFSSCKKQGLGSIMPGAFVTVALWLAASKAFEIYIANFSRFSVVYGSLGGVFVMMIWLNIISFVLLVGSEINAQLAALSGA